MVRMRKADDVVARATIMFCSWLVKMRAIHQFSEKFLFCGFSSKLKKVNPLP